MLVKWTRFFLRFNLKNLLLSLLVWQERGYWGPILYNLHVNVAVTNESLEWTVYNRLKILEHIHTSIIYIWRLPFPDEGNTVPSTPFRCISWSYSFGCNGKPSGTLHQLQRLRGLSLPVFLPGLWLWLLSTEYGMYCIRTLQVSVSETLTDSYWQCLSFSDITFYRYLNIRTKLIHELPGHESDKPVLSFSIVILEINEWKIK